MTVNIIEIADPKSANENTFEKKWARSIVFVNVFGVLKNNQKS